MGIIVLSTFLLSAINSINADETSQKKDGIESSSIVSRLDPALKKALLKALSNLEIDSLELEDGKDGGLIAATQTSTQDEELLEQSTATAQDLNFYETFLRDTTNFTQKAKDENEIIHTIIVKAPQRTTKSPIVKSEKKNDQVIIRFGNPDPVKESDVHIETVQIARSVTNNEINVGEDDDNANNGTDDKEDENDDDNDIKVTTYKPRTTTPRITTTTIPTTTTPAPTHNEDGENIESVGKNDVKIFQAPLVAAFTVQQDALGLPKNVIPLIQPIDTLPPAEPIQQFSLSPTTSAPITLNRISPTFETFASSPAFEPFQNTLKSASPTFEPFQSTLKSASPTFEPFLGTTPVALQLPSNNSPQSFTLSQSLELPSTKEATFSTFALEKKKKELEQQIYLLQQQQRQQEENYRLLEEQAYNRQQQLLLQQRYQFEEENRFRLQRYEQEQRLLRQQSQQQPQFNFQRFPVLNQLPPAPPQQQSSSSVQIIPSLSFSPSPIQIPTQQLLPVRDPIEFRSKQQISFQPQQQTFNLFPAQVPTPPHLATGPQLPLRPAQPFSNIVPTAETVFQPPPAVPSSIDPVVVSEQSQSRNRVFRHQSDTGNFGLNSVNTNFPPYFPVFNADNQLQSLLLQNGFNGGRQSEDLNIISKVLSLNHGISMSPDNFLPSNSGRFGRSVPTEKQS